VERIEQLEFQLHSFSVTSDYKKVGDLHSKVKDLCLKLEVLKFQFCHTIKIKIALLFYFKINLFKKMKNKGLEHLSWLGLFKNTRFYAIGNSLLPDKSEKKEKLKSVYEKFKKYS
jgi:hypothetical protein